MNEDFHIYLVVISAFIALFSKNHTEQIKLTLLPSDNLALVPNGIGKLILP